MDLPTCPTCGQSVLDDDAAECPFCGSPMKGGGGTKPAPKPAAVKPAAKPAAAKNTPAGETKTAVATPPTPAKMAAKPPSKPKSDDPFDIEGHSGAGAVEVSPKATKSKTLEVKCPMCETMGFVPPSAAGKDAKCCNSACKLPIFHVPAPKPVEAPPPPPPPRSSMPLFIGISALVVVLGVAGGVYLLFFANPPDRRVAPVPEGAAPAEMTLVNSADEAKTAEAERQKAEAVAAKPEPANEKLVDDEMSDLLDAVRSSRTLKAEVRRLAVVAAVLAGKDAIAQEQLEQLKKAEAQTEDDEIVPLVYIAWSQLAKGDTAGAKSTTDTALSRVPQLGTVGRYRCEAVLHLATLLAAQGRAAEAWPVLEAGSAGANLDSLTTAIEAARAQKTFDLDLPQYGRSVGNWDEPQAVGVTLLLCARGRWAEAQAWVAGAPNDATRGECIIVWAEAYARDLLREKKPLDPVTSVAATLKPGEKARLYARVAQQQLNAGDEAAAKASLGIAQAALSEVTPTAALAISNLKELEANLPPDPYPLRVAALAAADIGNLQAQLKQPDAWASFQKGLDLISRNAPSVESANALFERATNVAAIRKDFGDTRDDTARQRRDELQRHARNLGDAARARRRRETDLLEVAIKAGLIKEVWGSVEKSNVFLRSTLPHFLAVHARSAKLPEVEAAIGAAVRFDNSNLHRRAVSQAFVDQSGQRNIATALSYLPSLKDGDDEHEWRVRLVCRSIKAGKLTDAALMLAAMSADPSLVSDAFRLASALAARDQRSAFRNALPDALEKPHFISAYHAGVIDALSKPK